MSLSDLHILQITTQWVLTMGQALGPAFFMRYLNPAFRAILQSEPNGHSHVADEVNRNAAQEKASRMWEPGFDPSVSVQSRPSPLLCSLRAWIPWLYTQACKKMTACVRASHFSRIWLFATIWTVAHQAPLPMGCSRHECWSGLPCPPPGDLPHPGIEPGSPVATVLLPDSLQPSHLGNPRRW